MITDFDFSGEDTITSTGFPLFNESATAGGHLHLETPSFESVNSSSNPQTVSPKDIVMDVNFSAPASAALTNLSTPQTYTWDSPSFDLLHSADTSPNFLDEELGPEAHSWTPLFPTDSPSVDVKPSIEPTSPDLSASPSAATMARTHSSPGGRLSSVSGVKKSRTRRKDLPDLNPEKEKDPATKKRIRNTLAARKSRDKRARERDTHLDEIDQLRHELDQTKAELDRYKQMFKQRIAQDHFNYTPPGQ